MTFLNAILLGGLAAAAIPLIIHLLHRRRFRVVRWGAMDFLEDVFRTQRRRIRLEEWLLLAVRAALLGLLAFLMARPVLTGRRRLAGREPTSLLALIDNSLSMEAGDEVRTHYAAARAETVALLQRLPRGSEATALGLAGPLATPPEPVHDLEAVARAVEASAGGYGAPDLAARLEQAAGLFGRRARHTDRELVIVSDFQRANWSARDADGRRRAAARLDALPLPVRRVLFAPARDLRENVSVGPLEISRAVVGVQQPVRIRAPVRNHGARPHTGLRARLRVDGEDRGASEISLGPNERGYVLFTHRFDRAGSHAVEVEVEADRLRADNVGRAALEVLDRLPVLLVAGTVSAEPLRGEAGYLALALRPRDAAAPDRGPAGILEPTIVAERDFAAPALEGVRVAVLANVARLAEPQAEALDRFVRDGGGLLVLPGDRCDPAWYNARLHADGEGWLPAALAETVTAEAGAPAGIVPGRFDHPALALFNDPRAGGLRGAQFRTWHRLAPPAGGEDLAGGAAVLARLDTGAPFLVERRWGAGRVIVAAAPANAEWSNLPLRPFFVPLVQELTVWLASNLHPPRNVATGGRLAALLPAAMAGSRARVRTPDGASVECAVAAEGDRALATFSDTVRPGFYTLEPPGGGTIHFAVSPPPAESELGALSDDELRALAAELDATIVRTGEEYRALDRRRRFGRELWPALLAVVLGLAFVEIALANRPGRRAA